MKKILILTPFLLFNLHAEMMGENASGVFISDESRQEMQALLHDNDKKEEQSEESNENMSSGNDELNVNDAMNDSFALPVNDKKDENAIGEEGQQELSKILLKQYNIKYDKSVESLSCEKVSQGMYNAYLQKNGINQMVFKNLLNSDASIKSITMSAYYYDYYLQRPDLAENFYKLMYKRIGELEVEDKFTLADYLLRTGRGDMINKIFSVTECSTMFKVGDKCFYYLGVDSYLRTGNNKNKFLKIAKNKLKKAKTLYYQK